MAGKKPRIYLRIILFQYISIMAIMIVYGVVSFEINYSREITRMTSTTDRIADRLAANLSIPVWNLDKESSDNLVIQEVRDPYVTGIIIFQDKSVWLGKIKNGRGEVTAISDTGVTPEIQSLVLRRPLEKILYTDRKGKVWEAGELALYTTDQSVKETLALLLLQTVSEALVVIVTLGVLTAVVLNFLLHKPLRQITGTAQRIADGELTVQAEESATRELSTLARSFNSMTARLRGSLDNYFTTSLDLLCIADMDGRFRRLNREWEVTLGYPLEELQGRAGSLERAGEGAQFRQPLSLPRRQLPLDRVAFDSPWSIHLRRRPRHHQAQSGRGRDPAAQRVARGAGGRTDSPAGGDEPGTGDLRLLDRA
jgi:PAS domain-containing protein